MDREKPCRTCGVVKPAAEFYRSQTAKDGRKSQCKLCQCARERSRYERRKRKGERRVLPSDGAYGGTLGDRDNPGYREMHALCEEVEQRMIAAGLKVFT